MFRSPAVSGLFYPSDAQSLELMLNKFFIQKEDEKTDLPKEKLKGLILPHAGYVYSGQTAAAGYLQLKDLPQDLHYTIILIGPAHHAYLDVSVGAYDAYETPLGLVSVNQEIAYEIMEKNNWDFVPSAHAQEHCLEVQLPFLQKSLKHFSIVPILCGSINPQEVAKALRPYLENPNVLFLVSSDLSHFLSYQEAQTVDLNSLTKILNLDLEKVNEIDACGVTGIKTLMQIAATSDYHLQLLDYSNSGDTAGKKDSVVGYASLAFLKN